MCNTSPTIADALPSMPDTLPTMPDVTPIIPDAPLTVTTLHVLCTGSTIGRCGDLAEWSEGLCQQDTGKPAAETAQRHQQQHPSGGVGAQGMGPEPGA